MLLQLLLRLAGRYRSDFRLFKLIFFVLVDGWTLVAGSLIQSYGT